MKLASILMTMLLAFTGSFAHAMNNGDQYNFVCTGSGNGQNLTANFTVDFTTSTVSFSDTNAFQFSQMKANTPFGFTWTNIGETGQPGDSQSQDILTFTYAWYYQAIYYIDFSKAKIGTFTPGQTVALELMGYDDDGPGGIDVQLSCVVK